MRDGFLDFQNANAHFQKNHHTHSQIFDRKSDTPSLSNYDGDRLLLFSLQFLMEFVRANALVSFQVTE